MNAEPIKVLLVEDNPGDVRLLKEILAKADKDQFELTHVERLNEALKRLVEESFDVILLDISLPDSQGFDTFVRSQAQAPSVPIILLTGLDDEVLAVKAVREGAQDYLVKGQVDSNLLRRAIHYSIERHQMLAKLQAREANFRNVITTNIDGMIIVDKNRVMRFVNPAAEALLGRKAEELLGELFDFPVVTSETMEVEIIRKGGERVTVELGVVETEWEGEIGYLASLRDITERKHLEDQVRQSQKIEAVGRLAGGVAHDFNNQMMVILGTVNLAIPELSPDHPVHSDLQEIRNAGQRAMDLTSRLLAFSRRQIVEPQVLNPNDLLLNIDKMFRRLIGEDIELVILPEPNLGMTKMDPGQLEQVLVNLVVNARDAMPDGGKLIIETANITLDHEYARQDPEITPGEYVMLVVRDTGCGMTKEVKEHLFEPFFTTKEQDKGTGLGLSTCYGIVKQSGGHILVYSDPGRGSTFKIYLPCVEGAADALPQRDEEGNPPRGTETVLLVEDEPLVLKLVSRVLGRQGYTVLETANGEQALRVARAYGEEPIHLLLTDVVMPQMGGKEVADWFQAVSPKTKVLFMSGYTDDAIVRQDVLDTDVAFLQKPVMPEVLARKVREVMDT